MNHGTQIWVTNGEENKKTGKINWKKANIDGFEKGSEIHGSRAMTSYKDKLYIGTQCKKGIPPIYFYNGPTDFENIQPDKWECVVPKLKCNSHNIPGISEMACHAP